MASMYDMYEVVDQAAFDACDTTYGKTKLVWMPSDTTALTYEMKDLSVGQHFMVNPTYCSKGMRVHIDVTQVCSFLV
jgi:hypothetical protein